VGVGVGVDVAVEKAVDACMGEAVELKTREAVATLVEFQS